MKERQPIILSHSSIEAYRFDEDVQDRYYIPWRVVAESTARLAMGEQVLTILPRRKDFDEYLHFLSTTLLGGKKIPTLFTPDEDYLMDIDISNHLLPELLERTTHNARTRLYPYQATPEFHDWAHVLERERAVKIYADTQSDTRFWWGHKGAYHRWMDDLETPSPYESLGIPMAKGVVVQNKEELIRAKEKLPTEEVVAKGIYGAGGYEIQFLKTVDDISHYQWPYDPITQSYMPVVVQEKLPITRDARGERVYSLQFAGMTIEGALTRQIMDSSGKQWRGNQIPAEVDPRFAENAWAIGNQFLHAAKPVGDGGIDLADVNGEPYLIEVNGGRPTGATMPKRFQKAFAPHAPHFIFQKVQPEAMSAHKAWDILQRTHMPRSNEQVVFQKEQQAGVFPLVWLHNSWALLGSFADSFEKADVQLQEARMALGI